MTILLRPTQLSDATLLTYWDTKPHVVFATGGDGATSWQDVLAHPSPYFQMYIAEDEDRPIGIIQICDCAQEEEHYWGNIDPNFRALDIWIGEESDLSKGYGTRMMELAITACFTDTTVNAILIDPLSINTRAIHFYQKLGFQFLEKRAFGDDHCDVYILQRE